MDQSAPVMTIDETTREKLRQMIASIERLEEEKKEVVEQIKDIYAEAKAFGLDTKAMRTCVRLKKQDKDQREEQEMVLETYMVALGLI